MIARATIAVSFFAMGISAATIYSTPSAPMRGPYPYTCKAERSFAPGHKAPPQIGDCYGKDDFWQMAVDVRPADEWDCYAGGLKVIVSGDRAMLDALRAGARCEQVGNGIKWRLANGPARRWWQQ